MVTLIPRWARRRPVAVAPAPAPVLGYDPHDDGRPDPGEIVWTWVPYEDDSSQGKDRPVLLIGRLSLTPCGPRSFVTRSSGAGIPQLLGLYLTSKDHDRDADQEARAGRFWMDVGSGAWDRRGRPSEVRLDRLLVVDPAAVRREGATMPRERFEAVLAAARAARPSPRRQRGWRRSSGTSQAAAAPYPAAATTSVARAPEAEASRPPTTAPNGSVP